MQANVNHFSWTENGPRSLVLPLALVLSRGVVEEGPGQVVSLP